MRHRVEPVAEGHGQLAEGNPIAPTRRLNQPSFQSLTVVH